MYSIQVEGVQPPEGYGIQNLLSVITSTGKTWIFCGESLDDMRAWQLALEQARLFGMHPHLSGHPSAYMPAYNPGYLPAYSGDTSVTYLPQFTYPSPAYYGYPGPQYMTANPGQTALVYHPERYRHDGADMAMGMLGGAAAGSLMWGPLLWW
ncbi:UNVERIFIED_CONTAM: Plekhb2 [Trichonephila clavipes]